MKKRTKVCQIFAMVLAGMLVLSSCGTKEGQQKVEELTEKLTQSVSLEEIDLDSLDLNMGVWKDNSYNLYSATYNYELKRSYPEEAESGGGAGQVVANTRAYRMKKHLFKDPEKCWDEISYVTEEGDYGSKAFTERMEQIWAIGTVKGTDDVLLETITWQDEGGYAEHHAVVLDKDMNRKQDILLEFLNGEEYLEFENMMMDAMGNLHLVYRGRYTITNPNGAIISEYEFQGDREHLYFMSDGLVALKIQNMGTTENALLYSFVYYDMTQKNWCTLAEFEANYNTNLRMVICPDKDTLLYANDTGIYKGNPANVKDARLVYEWKRHGMLVTDIRDLQYLEGDRIALIYEEGSKMYYLNLEPTTEKVPIKTITFAVPSYRINAYEKAVAAFNRRYPTYQVVLWTDYDQTALLTKLMAGDGPVMIDTYLTGFDTQKELWLPLDKILEKLELTDELVLPAMELGAIDGQLYGVVNDFYIDTVVTIGDEPRNWNYDVLTEELLGNQKLEALVDTVSCPDGWTFVGRFLLHGLEDNYFIDWDSKQTRFKEPQMRQVLETIKKYYSTNERYKLGELLEEGGVLCNQVNIMRPEQLALYRMYYGEKLQYSGYPAKNGGKHILRSNQPVTIRRNASKEEVIGACLFLQTLLSYEVQTEKIKNDMHNLSVRKDVLEEQLAAVNQYTNAYAMGIEQTRLGNSVDHEKDKEIFYHLLENATPQKVLPRELLYIISDELVRYFDGEITVDMLLEHLENRVQLYLDEN